MPTPTHSQGVFASLLAGGLAGMTAWTLALPDNDTKSFIQSDVDHSRYRGVVDCARQVYRNRGIPGFFAGLTVIFLRAFPVNAIIFLVYTKSLRYLDSRTTDRDFV